MRGRRFWKGLVERGEEEGDEEERRCFPIKREKEDKKWDIFGAFTK